MLLQVCCTPEDSSYVCVTTQGWTAFSPVNSLISDVIIRGWGAPHYRFDTWSAGKKVLRALSNPNEYLNLHGVCSTLIALFNVAVSYQDCAVPGLGWSYYTSLLCRYNNNNNNNNNNNKGKEIILNNNIYLTAIGLSPGGSGFKHIYKYLTLCYWNLHLHLHWCIVDCSLRTNDAIGGKGDLGRLCIACLYSPLFQPGTVLTEDRVQSIAWRHQWLEQPQNLVSSKANAPNLQVRDEDVRRRGCEAPSIPSRIVTRMAVLSQYLCQWSWCWWSVA